MHPLSRHDAPYKSIDYLGLLRFVFDLFLKLDITVQLCFCDRKIRFLEHPLVLCLYPVVYTCHVLQKDLALGLIFLMFMGV